MRPPSGDFTFAWSRYVPGATWTGVLRLAVRLAAPPLAVGSSTRDAPTRSSASNRCDGSVAGGADADDAPASLGAGAEVAATGDEPAVAGAEAPAGALTPVRTEDPSPTDAVCSAPPGDRPDP